MSSDSTRGTPRSLKAGGNTSVWPAESSSPPPWTFISSSFMSTSKVIYAHSFALSTNIFVQIIQEATSLSCSIEPENPGWPSKVSSASSIESKFQSFAAQKPGTRHPSNLYTRCSPSTGLTHRVARPSRFPPSSGPSRVFYSPLPARLA